MIKQPPGVYRYDWPQQACKFVAHISPSTNIPIHSIAWCHCLMFTAQNNQRSPWLLITPRTTTCPFWCFLSHCSQIPRAKLKREAAHLGYLLQWKRWGGQHPGYHPQHQIILALLFLARPFALQEPCSSQNEWVRSCKSCTLVPRLSRQPELFRPPGICDTKTFRDMMLRDLGIYIIPNNRITSRTQVSILGVIFYGRSAPNIFSYDHGTSKGVRDYHTDHKRIPAMQLATALPAGGTPGGSQPNNEKFVNDHLGYVGPG